MLVSAASVSYSSPRTTKAAGFHRSSSSLPEAVVDCARWRLRLRLALFEGFVAAAVVAPIRTSAASVGNIGLGAQLFGQLVRSTASVYFLAFEATVRVGAKISPPVATCSSLSTTVTVPTSARGRAAIPRSSTACNVTVMTLTVPLVCHTGTLAPHSLKKPQITLNDVCFSSSSARFFAF